jgi:hypothetical protein
MKPSTEGAAGTEAIALGSILTVDYHGVLFVVICFENEVGL